MRRAFPIGVVILVWVWGCGSSDDSTGTGGGGGTAGSGGASGAAGVSGSSGAAGGGGMAGSAGAAGTGTAACLDMGGSCTGISSIANPCIKCATGMVPADGPDPRLECPGDGSGGGAPVGRCCLPNGSTSACATAGGGCYDGSSCPTGWESATDACDTAQQTCCVPGPSC